MHMQMIHAVKNNNILHDLQQNSNMPIKANHPLNVSITHLWNNLNINVFGEMLLQPMQDGTSICNSWRKP